MATSSKERSSGTFARVWLPHSLGRELRKHAEAERRSLSSTIRLTIEDRLQAEERCRRALSRGDKAQRGAAAIAASPRLTCSKSA